MVFNDVCEDINLNTGNPRTRLCLPAVCALLSAANVYALDSVILEPSQDNTLYETAINDGNQQTEVSNGAGRYLFAGQTGTDAGLKLRRALLQFDLHSNLPGDVVIVFAQLSVYQSKAAPGSTTVSMGLHRVLQPWGEGNSTAFGAEGQGIWAEPGDATWHHRFYPDELWTMAGGSFESTPSAETLIGPQLQQYTWACNADLLDELNDWHDNPEMNFGWIIVGGESGGFNAHRFNSRENNNPEHRPKLTLVYAAKDHVFEDSFEQFTGCQ